MRAVDLGLCGAMEGKRLTARRLALRQPADISFFCVACGACSLLDVVANERRRSKEDDIFKRAS